MRFINSKFRITKHLPILHLGSIGFEHEIVHNEFSLTLVGIGILNLEQFVAVSEYN